MFERVPDDITPELPAAPSAPLLKQIAQSRWAVGGVRNCGNAEKTYTLEIAGNLANWRDGANNTYVERIDYNNETEARTITVRPHSASAGGPQADRVWLYSRIGADQVHVQTSGKKPFILGRCGS